MFLLKVERTKHNLISAVKFNGRKWDFDNV
jgi:hypothetical protein